ncbi:hypothetical protein Q7C36_012052 [Tachysurus vachellii]|uniref:Uncharacterized protein n=1 Tax=Tachysurus vachellii TaxID=175792 RepID=A0AA88MVJ5_TACVA|nr:hypothetical protein Q7C36_012052 [Tachysurus vachellii]
MDGEPDNDNWNETCGYLDTDQAADSQCSYIMPFFCYSVTKRQILRMKIRSSQDLSGPAVNAAILEKINQELKDGGMNQDILVKWRVKPNGSIFHKETESKKEEL